MEVDGTRTEAEESVPRPTSESVFQHLMLVVSCYSSGAADANGGLEENGHAEGKQEEAQPLREGLRSRGVEAEALAGRYTEQDTEEPQEEAGFSGRER